mgnify:CR=1 FL=1
MSTEFYSTKFNKTVNIPNPKVCGYRMSNRATKKGWSSGLRSGKDNGVVPQKLSRFSTDLEAECKHKCEGNRNWLNKNQRISFTKIKQGKSFEIKRPAFRSNTLVEPDKPVARLLPNEREGLGNRDITRPNFIAPDIRGRETLNFERLQAQDIAQGGIKVQLGDKTIEKLFKVQVPDPSDRQWLEERTRRITAGETEEQLEQNPPLGRPQRTISKRMNFGAHGLNINDNIELVKSAVEQGNADNRNEMAQVMASTAQILGNLGNLRNINNAGFNNLRQAIRRMSVPKHWRAMGFPHRYYTYQQYLQNAGLINLFLLSNLQDYPDRTFNEPVHSFNVGAGGYVAMSVANLSRILPRRQNQTKGKFLDLQSRSIYHQEDVVPLVNAGQDDGKLNGQDPPAGQPNNGQWIPDMWFTWDFWDGRQNQLRIPAALQGNTQGTEQPIPYNNP